MKATALLAVLLPLLTACGSGGIQPSRALVPPLPEREQTGTSTTPGMPGAVPSNRGRTSDPVDANSPASGDLSG